MISNLFRALLPAVLAVGALWVAAGIAKKAAAQNSSETWPTVYGVVVESEVKAGGTSENMIHDYSFRCVYQTTQGTFELDRLTRFGRLGTYFRGGPAELAETFTPGDVVVVHFNPDAHAQAVIGTGLTKAELFSGGAIILALVAIGLAGLLAAAEPILSPMVQYRPVASTNTGQFNRTATKPMAYSQV